MLIDVGQIVARKYELVRLLGRGSMGEVWSAHHQALREQVALKVLAWPPSGDDAEAPAVALERFRFEAQVAARLSRKTRHIVRVTDYGEDDGLPYLVMELLDGEALDAALRQRGPLPPSEATPIVSQIARALEQAHAEGVAHRDLKPANVFLTRDEEGQLLVKLLDFGIARTIHARRVQGTFSTAKGFVFGTPGYMSPEQTRASPKLDHRCDLWALATIAYQALTGHLPVDGNDADELMKNLCAGRIVPLRQRDPRLSEALGAFFDRAFADGLDDRFEGASSLAQAFELACLAAPAVALPSTPSVNDTGSTGTEFSATVAQDAMHMHRRARTRAALALAGVVVTALVTLAGAWRTLSSPRGPAAASSNASAMLPSTLPSPSSADSIAAVAPWAPSDPPVASESSSPPVAPAKVAVPPPVPPRPPPPPIDERMTSAPALAPMPAAHAKPVPDGASPHATHVAPRPATDRNDVF
ncbi:MAG TPA: serine/threonine-protein kinase [Polyangiaceae bacterium]|jgi:serine/threonine-protein kinase|nr:serine/threonine-protein kinase [Polyangiaceae bacterium]